MLAKLSEGIGKGLVRIFGSRNDRVIQSLLPIVDRISSLEEKYFALTDERLRGVASELRLRLKGGETLDDILPDAFAAVREAGRRYLRMRHFDVQLLGGVALHQGKIAEMVTGEGKTLVATSPAFLNALEGKGVFVVTVNDYLARRDRSWMAPVYEGLGLSVGVIQAGMHSYERIPMYRSDITYGTNSEFGFDYLRDNMKDRLEEQCQANLNYAIIDEVDSILIDEARTPLIISGPAEESTEKYYIADRVAQKLVKGVDFELKEKESACPLTEDGIENAQRLAGVDDFYTGTNMDWPHHIEQALRAHHLFLKDKEYIVKDGEVIIVDEFTGRLMAGRRWSDGLHQAIEAKEQLRIKEENQTLATITYQNYFRLFKKLSGMTGTALTEAAEFDKIYGLDVVVMPTNMPLVRKSYHDVVYRTKKEKHHAVVEEIVEVHQSGRPVLVGTASIENSELVSGMLQRRGIPHEVLNAKHHEREAAIVAKAGQMGNVTIATNMAGRGTDILLGPGVQELGGLHVVGTERHDARRIDNQLRGRCGRQGDPGSSRFFLSLEDDLMRIFANETVSNLLKRLGMEEGQDIQSGMVNRAIERAQKRVEAHHFEVRKNLLEYDAVMDEQRKLIYGQRQEVLRGENSKSMVLEMVDQVVRRILDQYLSADAEATPNDVAEITSTFKNRFNLDVETSEIAPKDPEGTFQRLSERVRALYDSREKEIGSEDMRRVEQFLLLRVLDQKWKEHLYAMDHLKGGIGLRAYGQIDPKLEYKREGYGLFGQLINSIQDEVTNLVFRLRVQREEPPPPPPVGLTPLGPRAPRMGPSSFAPPPQILNAERQAFRQAERQKQAAIDATHRTGKEKNEPIRSSEPKLGRNDPCFCGSGKKFKKCHGAGAGG